MRYTFGKEKQYPSFSRVVKWFTWYFCRVCIIMIIIVIIIIVKTAKL